MPSLKAAQFGDFTYQAEGPTITITRYTGAGGDIVVPGTISGLPVTVIGEFAFGFKPSLTHVSLPSGLTTIGHEAFYACTGLPHITLPGSVTNIQLSAFYECTGLTAIHMDAPNSAYSSKDGVLFDTSQETLLLYPEGRSGSYTVPKSVKSLGEGAFLHCLGLTGIILPIGLTEIGLFAFAECSSLTTLRIPSSVRQVGGDAVVACTALTAIHVEALNSNYSSLDGVLFDKLQEVLIRYPGGKSGSYTAPDSVTSIGESAFYECAGLRSVILPNVIRIEWLAFQFSQGLTNVSLPNSLTYIGSQAFLQTGLTQVTIPSSVTNIGDGAFAWTKLTHVTLPNLLTHLEYYTFRGCHELTTVILPESLTRIDEHIFRGHPDDSDASAVTGLYFKGNAPAIVGLDSAVFDGADNVTVYYRDGTTGWGSTFAGRPTALWVVPTYKQWAAGFDLAVRYPNASGPQDDADQDGVRNNEEMEAGTDPSNAGSVLRLELGPRLDGLSDDDKTQPVSGQSIVYFQSVPGRIYEVQKTTALGSQWKSVATVTATATQKRVVLNQPDTNGFYRVYLTP